MHSYRGSSKFRRWETAVLIAVCVAIIAGLWLEQEQNKLSDSVLRLHVLANSDGRADQELKLKVRDRVLQEAEAILPKNVSQSAAEQILGENLQRLAQAGVQVVEEEGFDYPVSAALEQIWFPTKEYDDFSLPCGQYRALRIVIGEGKGQNWWCVVFPPLCLSSASEQTIETALEYGLTDRQVALLTAESDGYVIKFKALEWLGKLKNLF